MNQGGQISVKQLILQSLGGRGQQYALAAKQCRHQVCKSFSHTSAGLNHQGAPLFYLTSHGQCHFGLSQSDVKWTG